MIGTRIEKETDRTEHNWETESHIPSLQQSNGHSMGINDLSNKQYYQLCITQTKKWILTSSSDHTQL